MFIRIAGLCGIIGALAYCLADYFLLGSRLSPIKRKLNKFSPIKYATDTNLKRGGLLGVFASPLYIIGIYQMYSSLKDYGDLATLICIVFACSWTLPAFIHGMYEPLGYLMKLERQRGNARSELRAKTIAIRNSINLAYCLLAFLYGIISAGIFFMIFSGKTVYPIWSATLLSPLLPIAFSEVLLRIVSFFIPEKNFLRGAAFSLGHLIVFITSTILLW